MANTLGNYNPIFYAQEGLIELEKALGMSGRVHRGYDSERSSFNKGEFINIKGPSTFAAQDAPSTAQDLDTESVQIQLNQWKEVKFKLSDKELAYTSEQIIADHIRPAAYALADKIDQDLNALTDDIPWNYDIGGTPGVSDITKTRQVLFDNQVPMSDGNLHFEMNGALEADLLALPAFAQQQGAGDTGVATQMRGSLGTRYGMEFFANQNVGSHVGAKFTDNAGTVVGAHAKGVVALSVTALEASDTLKKGDSFVVAGNTQRYVVTADTATDGSGAAVLPIFPALVAALSGGEVITTDTASFDANLAFHRNFAALATAPLNNMGNQLGAKVESITDPNSQLSIRARMFYVGDASEVYVALDILYGIKILNPNMAVRARTNVVT